MKYPEIVSKARGYAKIWNEPIIVYQNDNKFGFCSREIFIQRRMNEPLICLLTCLPDGGVAQ